MKTKPDQEQMCLEATMAATGWDEAKARKEIQDAKERLGISARDYRAWEMYQYPPEKQPERYRFFQLRRAKTLMHWEACIAQTMEATGWSRKKTIQEIKSTRERMKVSYSDYASCRLYAFPHEEQKAVYDEKVRQKKSRGISRIMAATGWDEQTAAQRYREAHERTECNIGEYIFYRFYDLTPEEQDQVFVQSFGNKISARYNVAETVKLFDNKEQTNLLFDEYLKRPWCVNTKITLEAFREKFKGVPRLIYKPLNGIGGHGVQAMDLTTETMDSVFETLTALPEGVVEAFVVQHPRMNQLVSKSVNTIRIATVSCNSRPVTADGKMMDVAFASVRMGNGGAIVDNIHSGGLVANIDLATGKLLTDAVNLKGTAFKAHPASGTVFRGFQIPHFHEAVGMVYDMIQAFQLEGYLGWDIAISENGPLLIEANTSPGPSLISAPYSAERRGAKPIMAKYLWDDESAKTEFGGIK